jgi:hypothetical protein
MSNVGCWRVLVVVWDALGGELEKELVLLLEIEGPVGILLRWVGFGGADGRELVLWGWADEKDGGDSGIVGAERTLLKVSVLSEIDGGLCRGLEGGPALLETIGFRIMIGFGKGFVELSSDARLCDEDTLSVYRP